MKECSRAYTAYLLRCMQLEWDCAVPYKRNANYHWPLQSDKIYSLHILRIENIFFSYIYLCAMWKKYLNIRQHNLNVSIFKLNGTLRFGCLQFASLFSTILTQKRQVEHKINGSIRLKNCLFINKFFTVNATFCSWYAQNHLRWPHAGAAT